MSEDAATSQAWRQSMRVDWGFFWWHVRLMLWYVVDWTWSEFVRFVLWRMSMLWRFEWDCFWHVAAVSWCVQMQWWAADIQHPFSEILEEMCSASLIALSRRWGRHESTCETCYSFISSSMLSLVPTCGVRCVPFPMSSKDSPVLLASTSFYSWDVWKSCDDVEN